jgi:translation initiation factor 2 alpha subunit (eIF-2alpha)
MPKQIIGFYKNNLPKINELVMITIKKFDKNVGFYVKMNEYSDKEALLNISQIVSGRTRKKVTSLIPLNSKQVAVVMDVTEDGKVDVSIKNVHKKDIVLFEKYYNCAKRLHSSIKQLSYLSKIDMNELYDNVVWNNFEKDYRLPNDEQPIHILHYFPGKLTLTEEYRLPLVTHHLKVFGPVIYTIKKHFILVSYDQTGMDTVINKLKTFIPEKKYSKKELSDDDKKYNITLLPIAMPKYEITISSTNIETNNNVLTLFEKSVSEVDNGFFTMTD